MADRLNNELRAELLRRRDADQEFRKRVLQGSKAVGSARGADVDGENTAWLAKILDDYGWLGRAAVGEDGSTAMWLLAQHADAQPGLQRRCLRLLADAVRAKDAPVWQWAYLLDRVLVAELRPQVFGTQLTLRGGDYQPFRLHDPDRVDARRARVGLQPMRTYLSGMRAEQPPGQPSLSCPTCGAEASFEFPEPGQRIEVTCSCGRIISVSTDDGPA